jgi:uncharacterized Tic20 family protein
VLEFDFCAEGTTNENFWLAILHLSSMFSIVIIPLLLWSWKKNQSYKIDRQGRQVLNFQITMTLTLFAALLLLVILPIVLTFTEEAGLGVTETVLVVCLPLPLVLIGIFCTYQGVVNATRALSDKPIHYALSIPFVR